MLRNRIAKLTGDWRVVEDLMQDLFVKIYRNKSKLSGDKAANYLMMSASNIARDYLRKLDREKSLAENLVPDYGTPETLSIMNERLEFYENHVRPYLKTLPETQREALLAYANGDNLAQEARKLNIPRTTYRSRRNAGLRKLQEKLPNSR